MKSFKEEYIDGNCLIGIGTILKVILIHYLHLREQFIYINQPDSF